MNTQRLFSLFALIFFSLLTAFCRMRHVDTTAFSIPYPQPLPDSVALDFLPGIVSTGNRDFGAAFSPDGKSFYFSRSEKNKSHIYATHHDGKNWTQPAPVSFNSVAYAEADPAFGLDGKLYFISNRPSQPSDTILDYDIWFVSSQGDGVWSAPENMEAVNSDSAEFYISFSQNGNLYFASAREGGFGAEDIYVSKFTHGHYETPENLGAAINSEKSEYDPFISGKEDFIVFTSSNREDTFGGGDLYGCKRIPDKSWHHATNLGKKFNTSEREYCAYIPPDNKFLFFSSGDDIKWIGIESLKKQLGLPQ